MEIRDLEEIFKILKQNDVTEFELTKEGVHIRLTRQISLENSTRAIRRTGELQPAIIGGPGGESFASDHREALRVDDNRVKVESPIVGTFYRRPSPDAEPFVREGDVVRKGETLCIVEAMKLMNEIEAPCDGRVEKIFLEDGHVVEYGEVLFLLNPEV